MGYIRDDGLSVVAGPSDCLVSAGTWTDTVASGAWFKRRTATGAPFYLGVYTKLLQHADAQRGSYLKSIDLWWKVGTAALTSLAATIYLGTFPADGAAFADPASQAFSYDAGHNDAAERIDVDEHKMTLTITAPFWVANDELAIVQLAVVAAAGSVFDWYGARFNFTIRL